ncbi:transposase family protein [Alteromonas sp. KUL17]|uniref:transposase family protein n=1 Tax=Alteromonas sp. KUL17 TaxID=2480796 RepID=UPI001141887A|nr:transposase family protein [Alteromonas sp. KUL17]
MFFESFTTHFSALVDHLQSAKNAYSLHDDLFVTLYGVIAGADIQFYDRWSS